MKASGEASHLGSTIFPSLPTESCFLRKRLFKLARWMLPSSGQMCPYSVSQFEGRRCKTQAPILLTLVCTAPNRFWASLMVQLVKNPPLPHSITFVRRMNTFSLSSLNHCFLHGV